MEPPPYEEVASKQSSGEEVWQADSKALYTINIREEVGVSRAQHVAALVVKLLPQIRERAKHGLSKSNLLILPSDQVAVSKKGELVGYPADDRPIVVQLEGIYDSTQFWTQQDALDQLRMQMLEALGGYTSAPATSMPALPERRASSSRSFWTRKGSKSSGPEVVNQLDPAPAPVLVRVAQEQANFRTENDFGLYETLRSRAVLMEVDIR